jgi:hypothetical protein
MKTITNTQTVERMNSHTDRRNQLGSFDPVGFTVGPPRRFEDPGLRKVAAGSGLAVAC